MTEHRLQADEAHLWHVRPEAVANELSRYHEILTPEEREAVDQFRYPQDRRDRVVSKAFVRSILSSYANVPAAAWRFRAGPHGKPEIDAPAEHRYLRFSVSHTKGLIAFLVAINREVGVDVECATPVHEDFMDIAARYFDPAETGALQALSNGDRSRRFLELWTLKEAYMKARGLGLSIPLDAASFDVGSGPALRPSARFDATLADDPSRWQFTVEWLDDTHVLATAIDGGRHVGVVLKPALTLLRT